MTALTYIPLLIAFLAGLAVLLLGFGIAKLRPDAEIKGRLNEYLATATDAPLTALELELSESFFKRALLPIGRRLLSVLAWMWPKNRLEELRHRLLMAGRPGGITSNDFIGFKGWCMLVVGGATAGLGYLANYPRTSGALVLWVLLTGISFFLPDIWLSRRITRRQKELELALPDTLDVLVAAMEAGLSFENAVIEIASKWRNALTLEMLHVQRDMGMGQSRREALLAMNYRTGVVDVNAFVSAINQAEELGVSITRVLTSQAEEMRIKRRQRAQEQANKAPIKMLFPMVFLIFPALFAVLLGPGVPELLRVIGGL